MKKDCPLFPRILQGRFKLFHIGHEAEAALSGQPATEETFQKAAEAAMAGAVAHRDNAFKIPLAKQAIVRALATVIAQR